MLLVLLISTHYINYYTPELSFYSCQDRIRCIEMLDFLETFIAILLTVVLFFLVPSRPISNVVTLIANGMIIVCLIIYYFYWNIERFTSYDNLKVGSLTLITFAVVLNTWYLGQRISVKKVRYLLLLFFPPFTLFLAFNKYNEY